MCDYRSHSNKEMRLILSSEFLLVWPIKEKCVHLVRLIPGYPVSSSPSLHLSTAAAVHRESGAQVLRQPFIKSRGHAGHRLTWAPPTVPCSRNRHMSPGKCGAERTGGCTGAMADPARGCSNPDTLSSSSRRRRGTEPTAERPPVPPGTPAAEPAEGPLRTAAAIFTGALVVAWRDDANIPRLSPHGVGA